MQTRSLNLPLVFVPSTFGRYYMRDDKNVFMSISHELIEIENDKQDNYVTLATVAGPKRIKHALLVALSFKRSKVVSHLWGSLDVGFVDGNSGNINPENMVILFPDGGLEHPAYPGFCYIPAFTRYVVSEAGEVFDTEKLKPVTIHTYADYESTSSMAGYKFLTLVSDVGNRTTVGLHRALALAFKRFPVNVDRLDVNHENGSKSDNKLSNLEWSTRRRNNLHATELGLRPDNHPVVIKSIFTGEERIYFSLTECARALGVHAELIRFRTLTDGQQAFLPGLLFKLKSSQTPWLEVIDPDLLLRSKGYVVRYACLDTETGVTIELESGIAVRQFLKIGDQKLADCRKHGILVHKEKMQKKSYVLTIVSTREKCESLFAEKQMSYLS